MRAHVCAPACVCVHIRELWWGGVGKSFLCTPKRAKGSLCQGRNRADLGALARFGSGCGAFKQLTHVSHGLMFPGVLVQGPLRWHSCLWDQVLAI